MKPISDKMVAVLNEMRHRLLNGMDVANGLECYVNTSGWKKYLKDPNLWIAKNTAWLELIDPQPGDSLYDIGAGCGFFMYLARELRGCRITGCDVDITVQKVFAIMKLALGVYDEVDEGCVTPWKPLPCQGRYDWITSLAIAFSGGWQVEEHRWFLRAVGEQLADGGSALLIFSAPAIQKPGVAALCKSVNARLDDKGKPWIIRATKEALMNVPVEPKPEGRK